MKISLYLKAVFSSILLTLMLTGCGGGGGSSTPTNPPPSGGNDPTYTAGVFADDDTFKNRCESPRTTTDINGNPYPDQAGSILYENHWLRSWSNDIYLWYNEMPDINPGTYNDPLAYFDQLRTTALTASGTPKDQFHFTQDTTEYEQRTVAGVSFGYGIDWALLSASPPRLLRIEFVEPGSPAAVANLERGDTIIEIDNVDVENGSDVDALNAGLFPSMNGEVHTFLVEPVGTNDRRTVTLTAGEIQRDPLPVTNIVNTANGDVGYMLLSTFGTFKAEDEVFNAMTEFDNANISDLVIDLRYNGGGFVYISSQLAYMVAGPGATSNKTYDLLRFNDKHPTVNPVTGETIQPTPFYNTTTQYSDQNGSGVALPFVNLNRVFILTTRSTCSASEALINGLRGIDVEVVLIGDTTCGKPYGFYATDNCGTTYFTIQFDGVNDKGNGGYSDGFTPQNAQNNISDLYRTPGCFVVDDFNFQLGATDEPLFAAALEYRNSGTCPAITKLASPKSLLDLNAPGAIQVPLKLNEKILLDPFKESEEN